MELIETGKTEEFKFKDITFLVRSQATAADRFSIINLGDIVNGKLIIKQLDMFKEIIKSFVVDWKGVTEKGKEVPYSFDALWNKFPLDKDESVFTLLVEFIIAKTAILSVNQTEKND